MMKTVRKDTSLKLMLIILSNCRRHSDLPFLPKWIKIDERQNSVCLLIARKICHRDKSPEQRPWTVGHVLILVKVYKIIEVNQLGWFKPYIDKNTELRMRVENDFVKNFFKLMNSCDYGKTMGNVRKDRDTKLVTTDKRRNYIASELIYHTTNSFSENLVRDENELNKC